MAHGFWNSRLFAAATVLLISNAAYAQMQGEGAPAPTQDAAAPALETPAADPAAPTAPDAPLVFDSQVAFSPTYSSGYYYASPYAGYTSLAYYASIYTSRRFGS